jgi:hypothetical protein
MKVCDAMRVGRDGESAALLLGGTDKVAGQVEALRAVVDFEKYAALGGSTGNPLKVERICFPLEEHSSGGVAENSKRRRFQRAQQTISHLLRLDIHVAVDTSDHEIQLGQSVFGNIHCTVAQDIAFESRKDP